MLYRRGDVVGLIDEESDEMYFGVIRGFVQDQNFNFFAALTWLVPKEPWVQVGKDVGFNKNAFVLGNDIRF